MGVTLAILIYQKRHSVIRIDQKYVLVEWLIHRSNAYLALWHSSIPGLLFDLREKKASFSS